MKTKNVMLLVICALFCKTGNAQADSAYLKRTALYLYKTEADFFTGKKIYRGQSNSSTGSAIKYKINDKTYKFKLKDSCADYFSYKLGNAVKIRPVPGNCQFYIFAGGNKDTYCYVYGDYAGYDKQGYLNEYSYFAPDDTYWHNMLFTDHAHNLMAVSIEEFLKSKPALLEKYNAEKKETDKKTWERNRLVLAVKYMKLFMADNKEAR